MKAAGIDGFNVRRRLGGPVHAAVDDHGEHQADDARNDIGPPPFGLLDDIGEQFDSSNGASRQKNEEEESDPDREQYGHRQCRQPPRRREGPPRRSLRTSSSLPSKRHVLPSKGGRDVSSSIPLSDVGMVSPPAIRASRGSMPPDLGGSERHRSHPRTGRIEHRIRDRRRDDGCRRLARTPGNLVRPVDQVDDDLGHIRETSGSGSFPS